MAPLQAQTLLSPAELSYLHSSLSLTPPIRPDSRLPTQFRPLVAETEILPGTNGSARICFADGTEAIVGVKAEVERSTPKTAGLSDRAKLDLTDEGDDEGVGGLGDNTVPGKRGSGDNSWVEMTIEIPGLRDDDSLPVFLCEMLTEASLASGELVDKLWINRRWHWKLYIDVLLMSPPLSYPLPLLSLTVHLALLSCRLPALKSELDEDPLFNDDWDAAIPLYAKLKATNSYYSRPPITLLVMAVGTNIMFDPTREELSVADAVLAVSLANLPEPPSVIHTTGDFKVSRLQLLSIRTVDPPSRLTTAGIPDSANTATGGIIPTKQAGLITDAKLDEHGVWHPPQGGMKRPLISKVVDMCLERGGVGEEVLAGLELVDIG